MNEVPLDFDYSITDEDEEIDVEVYYRCKFGTNQWLYPMTILGSIYKGKTLQQFVSDGIRSYKKDYSVVEAKRIFIDNQTPKQ